MHRMLSDLGDVIKIVILVLKMFGAHHGIPFLTWMTVTHFNTFRIMFAHVHDSFRPCNVLLIHFKLKKMCFTSLQTCFLMSEHSDFRVQLPFKK